MSSSIPPNPWYNGIIYNPEFFTSNTETLTIAYANKTYLRRVGANATSIATKTTFAGNLEFSGATPTITTTSASSNFNITCGSFCGFNVRVNTSTIGLGINFAGLITIIKTIQGQGTGTAGIQYLNLVNNSGGIVLQNDNTVSNMVYRQAGITNSHVFSTNGTGTTNLTLSNTTNTSSLPTLISYPSAAVAVNTFTVRDTTSNQNLQVYPFTTSGILSPFTRPGDVQLVAVGSAPGNTNLTIMPYSNNTVGIRLTDTSVLIGAGGTASFTPTSNILFSGTTATMTGNLTLSSASPTISSTSTTTDFVIQTASTGSQMLLKSQGATSLTLNGTITTLPTTALLNAGSQIIFRTLGTDANISATTSGTNINIDASSVGGQIKMGVGSNNNTIFGKAMTTLKGIDIAGSVTIALPLNNFYIVTATAISTITLPNPTSSTVYAGMRVLFRRNVAGLQLNFTTTGGSAVIALTGVVPLVTISIGAGVNSVEFISDGFTWWGINTFP